MKYFVLTVDNRKVASKEFYTKRDQDNYFIETLQKMKVNNLTPSSAGRYYIGNKQSLFLVEINDDEDILDVLMSLDDTSADTIINNLKDISSTDKPRIIL